MALESLRRYIEDQTELELYTGALSSFDNNELIRAEIDIDKVIFNPIEGIFTKFLRNSIPIEGSRVTLTTDTATITGDSNRDGYYDYTVLQILDGANRNKEIAIETSTVSGSTQTLNFFDTQAGLSGSPNIRVMQIGKFPMYRDCEPFSSSYTKTIPEFLKQAVAFQYEYRISEGNGLDEEKTLKSWSRNRDSHSQTFETGGSTNKTRFNRVSPQALDILISEGLIGEANT